MKLKLIEKKPEVADVTTFVFEPLEPFTWAAGQFLHYTLAHEQADDRGEKRWFTISTAPFEKNVHITTRRSEPGSTFKKALFDLPIGATIEAEGPEGDFVVNDPSQSLVFIAGGMGITPFRSILAEMDHEGKEIHAHLMYANRDTNFVFKDELDALAKKHPGFTIHYFSGEEKIDASSIKADVPNLTTPRFYISGPEPMVEAFEKMMLAMGIPAEHLQRDDFPGYEF